MAPASTKETAPSSPVDPLRSVVGRSTFLRPLIRWHWTAGRPYLSANVQKACIGAYYRAIERQRSAEGATSTIFIQANDLIAAVLTIDSVDRGAWTGKLAGTVAELVPWPGQLMPKEALQKWRKAAPPARATLTDGVLRWDAVLLLMRASELRARTNTHHESIGLRHVCFAALITREGQEALEDLGLLARGLPFLVSALSNRINMSEVADYLDDPQAWRELLADVAAQPLLIIPPARAQSGFTPDLEAEEEPTDSSPPSADPLGISADVTALADLILLDAARPPLAIGLFGSWGSGKSTLIARLKREIARQTKGQPVDPDSESDPQLRRVRGVAQLDFNAWSFADSQNLWASLTAEIFEQLKAPGVTASRRSGQQLVADVAKKLADVEQQQVDSTAAEPIKQEIAKLEKDIAKAEVAVKTAPATVAGELIFGENSPVVPFSRPTSGEADDQDLFQAKSTRRGRLWWLLTHSYSRPLAILAAGLLAIFVLAVVLLSLFPELASWWAWVAAFLLPLALLAASIGRPLWGAWVAAAKYEHSLIAERQKLQEKISNDTQKLDEKRAQLEKTRADAEARSQAVATLSRTKGNPARLLQYLLHDSTDIQSIQAQVGMLATVRRCFQTLNDLVTSKSPAAEVAADDAENAPRLERIILYIDDLDRCSAEQVVKVLEAVHLLLAFECFVVVVAIDARWLRLSLESSLPQFKADVSGQSEDKPSTSDYLEKIFQIPFWVRPLRRAAAPGAGVSAYAAYLDHLLGPREMASTSGGSSPAEAPANEPETSGGDAIRPTEPSMPKRQERPRLQRVRLTGAERDLLEALEPIAAKSPRSVKRFINIYRLIRAAIPAEQEAAFLAQGSGGVPSFAAVQLALAFDVGLPATSVPRLWAELAALSETSWAKLASNPMLLTESEEIPPLSVGKSEWVDLRAVLAEAGCLQGFSSACRAVKRACGELDRPDLMRAADLSQRFSFRPR